MHLTKLDRAEQDINGPKDFVMIEHDINGPKHFVIIEHDINEPKHFVTILVVTDAQKIIFVSVIIIGITKICMSRHIYLQI